MVKRRKKRRRRWKSQILELLFVFTSSPTQKLRKFWSSKWWKGGGGGGRGDRRRRRRSIDTLFYSVRFCQSLTTSDRLNSCQSSIGSGRERRSEFSVVRLVSGDGISPIKPQRIWPSAHPYLKLIHYNHSYQNSMITHPKSKNWQLTVSLINWKSIT